MRDLTSWKHDVAHIRWLRERHRVGRADAPSLAESIDRFTERWPEAVRTPGPDDDPVLLFSSGWRSGSTLLQRLVMSGGDVVIWGEPFNRLDLVRRLADTLGSFTPDYPTPDIRWPSDLVDRDLTTEWVANLYPDGMDLLAGHRRFHQTVFAAAAARTDTPRWGAKFVRLDAGYARYFRLLFPRARIVFLVRNPWDSYRSYRRQGNRWYDRWPDRPVFTPQAFGRVWHRTASSFLRDQDAVGALLVRYEDLITGQGVDELAGHCRTRVDSALLGSHVSTPDFGRRFTGQPTWVERKALERQVADTAAALGYTDRRLTR